MPTLLFLQQVLSHYLKVPIGSQYPQFQTATSVDTRVALADGLSAPLEIPQKNKSVGGISTLVFTRMSLRVESYIHTACRIHHGNSLPYPRFGARIRWLQIPSKGRREDPGGHGIGGTREEKKKVPISATSTSPAKKNRRVHLKITSLKRKNHLNQTSIHFGVPAVHFRFESSSERLENPCFNAGKLPNFQGTSNDL